jgi:hypothetical protein
MKTTLCLAAALLLLNNVRADPNRYPWRALPAANVGLQPLFTWWNSVSHTTYNSVDVSVMDTNTLAVVSNLWQHLPPRPLAGWALISASEDNIVIVGSMWKVDATIALAPMMAKRETIYIRNPPVKEIQDFRLTRATYLSLEAAQGADMVIEQYWESNIQAEASSMLPVNSDTNTGQPAQPSADQVRILQRDMNTAISNINQLHERTKSRDAAVNAAKSYLSHFPSQDKYWLDHFAWRTGAETNGIEIYDLGTSPGLTY